MTRPAFTVGDDVICLWTWAPTKLALRINVPEQGRVYRVRELVRPAPQNNAPYWSVLLEEIENRPLEGAVSEPSFSASAFERVNRVRLPRSG